MGRLAVGRFLSWASCLSPSLRPQTLPQWVPAEQLPVRYGGQCATPLGESELELQMAAYVRDLNEQAGARSAGAKDETAGAAAAADEAWHDAAGEAAGGASSNIS